VEEGAEKRRGRGLRGREGGGLWGVNGGIRGADRGAQREGEEGGGKGGGRKEKKGEGKGGGGGGGGRDGRGGYARNTIRSRMTKSSNLLDLRRSKVPHFESL